MTRVAALDCGTNTIRLLIADLDPATGHEVEVVREMQVVRLGEGVDRTGELSAAALGRFFGALDTYVALIEEHGAERVRCCATSAARDAKNAEAFSRGVEQRIGVPPEVVAGDEEARLSYAGATRALHTGLRAPYLVLDIGGGSTEVILGNDDGEVLGAHSLDIGSVRMTERHLLSDPPTTDEVRAAVEDVDAALDGCRVDPADAAAVIGVAGTVTTMAAAVLDLRAYDRTVINHAVLGRAAIQGTTQSLLAMTVEERRALPFMHPGRADVIGGGALILDRVLRRATVDSMLVSESDILDGIAWSLV